MFSILLTYLTLIPFLGIPVVYGSIIFGLLAMLIRPAAIKNNILNKRYFFIYLTINVFLLFIGSNWATFCFPFQKVETAEVHYYLHRQSVFLPRCGNIGVLNYGQVPAGYIVLPQLTHFIDSGRHLVQLKLVGWYLLISIFPAYLIASIPSKEKTN